MGLLYTICTGIKTHPVEKESGYNPDSYKQINTKMTNKSSDNKVQDDTFKNIYQELIQR